MKTENIKNNYSKLTRLHECDRRTIKKYNEGYEVKLMKRNKEFTILDIHVLHYLSTMVLI